MKVCLCCSQRAPDFRQEHCIWNHASHFSKSRHTSHVTRHTIWQLVNSGITKLAQSDWSPRPVESVFRYHSQQVRAGDMSTRGALGTRKQARDIMAGGWGGGRRQDESVQQQLQEHYGSAPLLLQGEPASCTQRAGSRSGHIPRTPPLPPRSRHPDASRIFRIQRMSIADDDDCDDRYDESMWVGHGSNNRYVHDSSSPPHHYARPSSPDFEQEEGWVGRPSTPDHVTATCPPKLPYEHMRPATAEISSWKHSLVHLDLSGNRCVVCAVTCAMQQCSCCPRLELGLPIAVATCGHLSLKVSLDWDNTPCAISFAYLLCSTLTGPDIARK